MRAGLVGRPRAKERLTFRPAAMGSAAYLALMESNIACAAINRSEAAI
jgi:hypothetical protein